MHSLNVFFCFSDSHRLGYPEREGVSMRFKPKSVAALDIALGSLPNRMRVEVDPDIEVSARTVGQLRKVTAWPENLASAVQSSADWLTYPNLAW